MNKFTLTLILLLVLSLACTNTAAITNTPAPKAPQEVSQFVQLVVTAEIGVQVRSACGVNTPTTGKILTNGEVVISDGKEQELPDGSVWQPIEGGCVNALFVEAVK